MTRIAIDASSALSGGGVTYIQRIVSCLQRHPDAQIGPILLRSQASAPLVGWKGVEVVTTSHRLGASTIAWHGAIAAHKCDVVFAPTEISFTAYRIPLVLALRNPCLLPANTSEYGIARNTKFALQRRIARAAAKRASAYIAVSNYAAEVGVRALMIDKHRITIVYHGGPSQQPESVTKGPVQRFLFVSNVYRYKNLGRLLEAFTVIKDEWTLDVVGRFMEPRSQSLTIELCGRLGITERVRLRGHLTGMELDNAYRSADCFVWPSYAETFGHPLLEAHSHGLPILAARAGSNSEITGSAAIYFDPLDVSQLSSHLKRAMKDGVQTGPLPRQYSWETCAAETLQVLHNAAATE